MTNSFGSFAMGSCDRVPRRKYHGLWISRAAAKSRPEHLLLDVLERLELGTSRPERSGSAGGGRVPLMDFDFGHGPGTDALPLIDSFAPQPAPCWRYRIPGRTGTLTRMAAFIDWGGFKSSVEGVELVYEWKGDEAPLDLQLEPLFTLRDFHSLARESLAIDGAVETLKSRPGYALYEFQPYADSQPLQIEVTGSHEADNQGRWYHHVFYEEERNRGYPAVEDCFRPLLVRASLAPRARLALRFLLPNAPENARFRARMRKRLASSRLAERPAPLAVRTNTRFFQDLSRALGSFVHVDQGFPKCESVIAGYPWFSSWGRDTFICLPGLSLAWNDPARALAILKGWAPLIESRLFPEHDRKASASVDMPADANASGLDTPFHWAAALRFLCEEHPSRAGQGDRLTAELVSTLERWIIYLFQGECALLDITDFGLRCAAGSYATSWMDALVDGVPVTPRHGYPIEINALFLDTLDFLLRQKTERKAGARRLFRSYLEKVGPRFGESFWVAERAFVGDGHDGVTLDGALRPNQLWALCSPLGLVTAEQARSALARITEELLTPVGLRTLSPRDSRYLGLYHGDQARRDRCYHQGTVWPWLIGKYTEAMLKHEGAEKTAQTLAPVLEGLAGHFYHGPCPGQISEIFDGDSPHHPRGAPAQAWSAAETLRTLWLLDRSRS